MSDSHSESDFFGRLNRGSDSAFHQLDEQYREQLCGLVRREMGRRFAAREDPEDVVQSVFRSFFRGVDVKKFRIDHSGGLWRLLEKIAIRKILKHAEYHRMEKRHPGAEVRGGGDQLRARDPTPQEAAQVADLVETALDGLEPPDPEIFRLRLQGYTEAKIAESVGCARGAVRYKLGRIRQRLAKLLAEGSDD